MCAGAPFAARAALGEQRRDLGHAWPDEHGRRRGSSRSTVATPSGSRRGPRADRADTARAARRRRPARRGRGARRDRALRAGRRRCAASSREQTPRGAAHRTLEPELVRPRRRAGARAAARRSSIRARRARPDAAQEAGEQRGRSPSTASAVEPTPSRGEHGERETPTPRRLPGGARARSHGHRGRFERLLDDVLRGDARPRAPPEPGSVGARARARRARWTSSGTTNAAPLDGARAFASRSSAMPAARARPERETRLSRVCWRSVTT